MKVIAQMFTKRKSLVVDMSSETCFIYWGLYAPPEAQMILRMRAWAHLQDWNDAAGESDLLRLCVLEGKQTLMLSEKFVVLSMCR